MSYVFKPEMDAVMAGMPFGYLRADLHAHVIHSNGYLEKAHDISFEQVKGSAWQDLVHPEDKRKLLAFFAKDFFLDTVIIIAVKLLLPGKKLLPIQFMIDNIFDEAGKRIGFLINVIDVSPALHDLCESSEMSHLDPLTRAFTRTHFLNKLDAMLRENKNHSVFFAVVVIDLKGLEKFNEVWGYTLGDQLLSLLAETISKVVNNKYILGRVESGKFGLIIDKVQSHEKLKEFISHLYTQCNKSITLPQGAFNLEISMGVAITKYNDGNLDPFLRHGLEALKLSKKKLPRIEYLDDKDHRTYHRSARIASYMFDAIAQDQFELHYQPQINIDTNKIVGIEVLLRWNHSDLGIIEPDEFIPIAEDAGFIVHVGKWVMEHAFAQYQVWQKRLGHQFDGIKLSINLSPLQLLDQNLIPDLSVALNKYKIKAENLIFELTETAMMRDPQGNIQVMNQIKDLGVNFSMDDFGMGYSSLNYMRYLPIYQIKIDRSFVNSFQQSRQDAAITKATLSLAEALGVEVIAEGVETEAEIKFLRDNGCKLVQGFYYSHPLNAKGMEEYIEANTRP